MNESCHTYEGVHIYSLLHLECRFFIFNSQSMIWFARSLLPRSVEKRPKRLRLGIEIKWHSKCNRQLGHVTHVNMVGAMGEGEMPALSLIWMSHFTYELSHLPQSFIELGHVTHGLSHVTRMNDSYLIYGWVMSNIYGWVMSHVWIGDERWARCLLCLSYERVILHKNWVIWHVWTSHVTYIYASYHTWRGYGVATISRLLKTKSLFCRT